MDLVASAKDIIVAMRIVARRVFKAFKKMHIAYYRASLREKNRQ